MTWDRFFSLVWIISWFAAIWVYLVSVDIAHALFYTGLFSLVLGMLVYYGDEMKEDK